MEKEQDMKENIQIIVYGGTCFYGQKVVNTIKQGINFI